jgi:two-component system, OmpR family, sensor kinase
MRNRLSVRNRHERWHRRHDFRLQRALFWWFGITICVTSCVSFGVMRLVSPEMHSWRRDADRLQAFAAGRFEKVWDDAPARHELMQAMAQAFDVSVQAKNAQGKVIDSVGGACESGLVTIDVARRERVLGTVQGCFRQDRGLRWTALGATLFAAFITIWAATAKLTRRLTRPLQDLTRVTREIGEGKLESRVRLNHHHRGEVGILAESINEMAKRIERQLKDQRELLAGVSHEIRSPLARLRVLAELLQSGTATPDLHAKIEREVVEIDDLVGKLLASSRLDFGALDLQLLCARDVALRALERANLSVELLDDSSDGALVQGDATLLSRALGNLLENAQHHAGGVARLILRVDGEHVYFEVTDGGPGLSAEALSHGFDPFFRGSQDGQTSSRGALGLGLSLVQRIARAHGGDASIGNRSNQPGAIAMIFLPRLLESAPISAGDVAASN